jgi:hypothetical protein
MAPPSGPALRVHGVRPERPLLNSQTGLVASRAIAPNQAVASFIQ